MDTSTASNPWVLFVGSFLLPLAVAVIATLITNRLDRRKAREDLLAAQRLVGLQAWSDALASAADACLYTAGGRRIEGEDGFARAERAAAATQTAGVVGSQVSDIMTPELRKLAADLRIKCVALFANVVGHASVVRRPADIPDELFPQFDKMRTILVDGLDQVRSARAAILGVKP